MIDKIFDTNLQSYIRNNISYAGSSKTAHKDLNQLAVSINRPIKGKLYMFDYRTPDEEIYDTLPISLLLDINDSKNFVGLNLHYLPRPIKEYILKRVLNSYAGITQKYLAGKFIESPLYQKPIKPITYRMFSKGFRDINYQYGIKQYKLNRISNIKCIGYEHWHIALCHNENRFVGSNISLIQESYNSI